MNNNFSYYITIFFKDYLPKTRGLSKNTILSYRDTFIIFIEYLNNRKIDINKIALECINFQIVEDFLNYLEENKKCSVRTRNQRLAAIKSFYKFIQKRELTCYELCSSILSIQFKKFSKKSIAYFSVNEIEILLSAPKTKTKYGFRDYVILLFMYETACRAQELCDLKGEQIYINSNNNFIILKGKGNKERSVPISKELSKTIEKYLSTFEIRINDYVFKNKNGIKLTRKGIEYILLKYIKQCKQNNSNLFKNTYSNHSMRHTRAIHLLESGINLIYIRDILGHSSIITTEEYAKVSPKIKEEQILKYSKSINVKDKYNQKEKEDLINFLKNEL